MAHDVFISHSSKDKLTVDAICHSLEKNGIRCRIAPKDVRAGANYGAKIIRGILKCILLILVFSGSSNASSTAANTSININPQSLIYLNDAKSKKHDAKRVILIMIGNIRIQK